MNKKQNHQMKILKRLLFFSGKNARHPMSGALAFNELGIYRLSAVIHRLRESGLNIITIMKKDHSTGTEYAEYHLAAMYQDDKKSNDFKTMMNIYYLMELNDTTETKVLDNFIKGKDRYKAPHEYAPLYVSI